MKKIYTLILLALCSVWSFLSCQKNEEAVLIEGGEVEEVAAAKVLNLSVPYPALETANGTKVTRNPATGVSQWVAGDKIVIYGKPNSADPTNYVVHTITPAEISDPTVANISVDVSAIGESYYCSPHHYSIAYPADDWDYYSKWSSDGRGAFTNTNQILLGGYIADDLSSATLYNLSAVIAFKVSGDYDSYNFFGNDGDEVVGYSRLVYNMNTSTPLYVMKYGTATYGTLGDLTTISGSVNGDGSTYNFICIPRHHDPDGSDASSLDASFPSGFTIQFVKNGNVVKYVTSTAKLDELQPGHYVDLGLIPDGAMHDYESIPSSEKATAVDKSEEESANCYVVNAGDSSNKSRVFKFRAVRGNSYVKGVAAGTSVGAVASVKLLWETWNNGSSVTPNSVISKVDFKDDYIYFKMPAILHAGNAVIAAKDDSDNILWSWHIWVPESAITESASGIYSKALMDRNLGALVVTSTGATAAVESFGLLYQWGRKDPFPGPIRVDNSNRALVSGMETTSTAGDGNANDDSKITLAQSIANPTLLGHRQGGDWVTPSDNTLWNNAEKTQYDPCPPGYRVPARDKSQQYHSADLSIYTGWEDNATYKYFTLGSPLAVFPYTGYYDTWSSNLSGVDYVGTRTVLWTAYASSAEYAYEVSVRANDRHKLEEVGKCNTSSIRCCAVK